MDTDVEPLNLKKASEPTTLTSSGNETHKWACCITGECEFIKKRLNSSERQGLSKKCSSKIECDVCQKPFSSKSSMKNHRLRHIVDKPYTCEICLKSFANPFELKKHTIVHVKKKLFSCKICAKTFTRRGSLRVHQRLHTDVETKFECTICKKKFVWKSNYTVHCASHLKPKTACAMCRKTFESVELLQKHQTIHNTDAPKFPCQGCEKNFSNPYKLNYHIKLKHPNVGLWECQYCYEPFGTAVNLRSHIHAKHTNGKPFRCDVCKRTFLTTHNLKLHESQHRRPSVYECEMCGQKFRYKRNLYAHIKRHEIKLKATTGKKSRKCMRKVFEQNQHFCSICGRGFAYKKVAEKCTHDPRFTLSRSQKQKCQKLSVMQNEATENVINNEDNAENYVKIQINFVSEENQENRIIPLYELKFSAQTQHVETSAQQQLDDSETKTDKQPVVFVQTFTTPSVQTLDLNTFSECTSAVDCYDNSDDPVNFSNRLSHSIQSICDTRGEGVARTNFTYNYNDEPIDYSLPKPINTSAETENQNIYQQL